MSTKKSALLADINEIISESTFEEYKRRFEDLQDMGIIEYHQKRQRKLPDNIDIVREYELIQKRQSKLSKWERDAVVHTVSKLKNGGKP